MCGATTGQAEAGNAGEQLAGLCHAVTKASPCIHCPPCGCGTLWSWPQPQPRAAARRRAAREHRQCSPTLHHCTAVQQHPTEGAFNPAPPHLKTTHGHSALAPADSKRKLVLALLHKNIFFISYKNAIGNWPAKESLHSDYRSAEKQAETEQRNSQKGLLKNKLWVLQATLVLPSNQDP